MDTTAALKLCELWLPLWTGNRPEKLIEVYADDVLYRDPAKPEGIRGKAVFGPITISGPDTERSDARIVFDLGYSKGTVMLDDVRFYEGAALQYWTREFEHGYVIVNPDRQRQVTANPPTGFSGIVGNPTGFEGTLLPATINVGPLDAVLLRRP